MILDLLLIAVASCLIVWSNIITYNIPAMGNKAAERLARVISVSWIVIALVLVSYVA